VQRRAKGQREKRNKKTEESHGEPVMALSLKSRNFLESEQATTIRKELKRMMADPGYNTRPTYSALAKGDVLFADKHIGYLCLHLNVDPNQYLSNLKLLTKTS
jgi:hypothetical protein